MSVEESKSYEDDSRWMQRVVMFHSTDAGRTWGPPSIAGFDPTGRIFNWDLRTGVAPDGRVVTFAWTYNSETREYLNIHRRISTDNGRTWSPAEDLGFTDQAGHPAILPDGRVVLPWVDRFGTQTIRARVAPSVDAPFEPESEVVIYRHREGATSDTDQAGALGPGRLVLRASLRGSPSERRRPRCILCRDRNRDGHSLGENPRLWMIDKARAVHAQ